MYEVLVGETCYTASEQQKLLARITEKSATKVAQLSGHWVYYVHYDNGLEEVKQLLQLPEQSRPPSLRKNQRAVDIYITPRNTISPWSSKATNIAHVSGLKDRVRRIERGRLIHIDFDEPYEGELDLSFRDAIYDRMTESFGLELPDPHSMFADGVPSPLVVVDIFVDGKDSVDVLQEYNQRMGLGLDRPNMEYLVAEYRKLGRPPT